MPKHVKGHNSNLLLFSCSSILVSSTNVLTPKRLATKPEKFFKKKDKNRINVDLLSENELNSVEEYILFATIHASSLKLCLV